MGRNKVAVPTTTISVSIKNRLKIESLRKKEITEKGLLMDTIDQVISRALRSLEQQEKPLVSF